MSENVEATSLEEQRQAELFNHREMAAAVLKVDSGALIPQNMGEKFERRGFFNYYFAEIEQPVFVKTGRKADANQQLRREAAAVKIADILNIPAKKPIEFESDHGTTSYFEKDGVGLVAQELLSADEWTFLVTPEMIAGVDEKESEVYAKALAISVMQELGEKIPKDISIENLRHDQNADWKYRSPEHCNRVWDNDKKQLIENIDGVYVENTDVEIAKVEGLVAEAKARMDYLLSENSAEDDVNYFVHGDFDANNLTVKKDGSEHRILDFEHAGATQFRPLAKLTDFSNAYGRCWTNPGMQTSFVRESMRSHKEKSDDDAYHLIRSSIIMGTFGLAKYGMKADHHEHIMSVRLLNQLDPNLRVLDEAYAEVVQARA